MRTLTLIFAILACAHTPTVLSNEPQNDAVFEHVPSSLDAPAPEQKIEPGDILLIPFHGDVDRNLVDDTIEKINKAVAGNARGIVLEINTRGGQINAGFDLAKAIERAPLPIYCVVDSKALSMGFYILQSCDQRFMTSRSILMAHEPSLLEVSGNRFDLKEAEEELRVIAHAIAMHMGRKLNITPQQLEEKIRGHNWWLEESEALKVGAVDAVLDRTEDVIHWFRNPHQTPSEASPPAP